MSSGSEKKYLVNVRRIVGKAINRYGLIQGGDRVAIPVSGGKDSFVLLETLCERRRYIPVDYEIIAVHVTVANNPYEIHYEFFQSLCKTLGVPLHFLEISFDNNVSDISPCFLCSWHRRKALFRFAAAHRCNRLALGHHKDDAIETLLMNMIHQGTISSMPPKLSMFKGEFDIIRPLLLLSEYEVGRYARIRQFPGMKIPCAYGETNRRTEIKRMLQQIYRMNRKARDNIFRSMSNIHGGYLPSGGDLPSR
jgi:tRNA 2-thiocytidine biosynthesis protein TtcA